MLPHTFAVVGSIDDGKSTLIGRLLFDLKALREDQISDLDKASRKRGHQTLQLALITDGLRSEREQGITIDVAYRFFSSEKSKFKVIDCPGHEQYTRNMVTGASQAQSALILVDISRGIQKQTLRHATVLAWLGVERVVVCVNKMDLVGNAQSEYAEIVAKMKAEFAKIGLKVAEYIPISAESGENVARQSALMPWYHGPTLIQCLDRFAEQGEDVRGQSFLLSVQGLYKSSITKPGQWDRWVIGRIEAGVAVPGMTLVHVPSGTRAKIEKINTPRGVSESSELGGSVSIKLDKEIDIQRGDAFVLNETPMLSSEAVARVCVLGSQKIEAGGSFTLNYHHREVVCEVDEVVEEMSLDSLASHPASVLEQNSIGQVRLRFSEALPLFNLKDLPTRIGGAILIDRKNFATAAAVILEAP